jgi:catechol 2,3-dioxygenase-like lactoylglutathione lyase family enzyme
MANAEHDDRSAWSALEVGLPVHELAPMRRFYCEGLGFKPAGHVDLPAAHIEALRFGNCLLKLSLFSDESRRPNPHQANSSNFYLTLRVSNLDHAVSSCLAVGASLLVSVSSAETKDSRKVRFAFVTDPMGNRIELVEGNAWSEQPA